MFFGIKNKKPAFSSQARRYAKGVSDHPMIRAESRKLSELYVRELRRRIDGAVQNVFTINLEFALSRMGIIYFHTGSGSVDMKYADYGIEPVEDAYKREAIAMLLSENTAKVVMEQIPEIKDCRTQVRFDPAQSYAGWVYVTLSFDVGLRKFSTF